MNIPYFGINKFLDDNREMSAGEMPITREDFAIHLTYVDGVQTMGHPIEDDWFWPDDGDTIHFLDATGRHVFAHRKGQQLILLMEVTMPEDREIDAEFIKQTSELHQPDTFDLVPIDFEEFIKFMEMDPHLNTKYLHHAYTMKHVDTPFHQPAHSEEGETPMSNSNAAQKVEQAGAKVQGAVGTATAKIADGVDAASSKMEQVSDSVRGKIDDVRGSAEHLRDATVDAAHNVKDRVGDLAGNLKDTAATAFETIDPRGFWQRHDMTKRTLVFLAGVGFGYFLRR